MPLLHGLRPGMLPRRLSVRPVWRSGVPQVVAALAIMVAVGRCTYPGNRDEAVRQACGNPPLAPLTDEDHAAVERWEECEETVPF